jgi:hypothetical protein
MTTERKVIYFGHSQQGRFFELQVKGWSDWARLCRTPLSLIVCRKRH